MYRNALRWMNGFITFVEALVIVAVVLFAGYALWDNQQIYDSVTSLQNDLIAFKPEEDASPSFEELQAINPDVCAWLTMDGTRIDFPVLRGKNNQIYLSLDVYGKTSIAGSIYLDARNAFGMTDAYNLLHGHHLDQGRMFGDLDLYKQESFFRENTTGMLLTPGGTWRLDVIAYLNVQSTDMVIFAPQYHTENAAEVLDYAEDVAIFLHEDTLATARGSGAPLIGLATCADGSNRTVVLCMMTRAEGGAAQ